MQGTIVVPTLEKSGRLWYFEAQAFSGEGKWPKVRYSDDLRPAYWGLNGGFWLPNFGCYSSHPTPELHKRGILMGYDLAMEGGNDCYRFIVGTSWSGSGRAFTFSEPFWTRYQRFLGNRQTLAIGPFASLKLVKIKHVSGSLEYRQIKWGVDGGLSLETPFERVSYAYSTPAGGYHTAELFLVGESSSAGYRVGTLFTLRKQDRIWMFQMGIHIEGSGDMEGIPTMRENRRPLPVKLLEYSGVLPFLPIYGIYWCVNELTGHKHDKK